jgi:ABC-2 type transport system permease protein
MNGFVAFTKKEFLEYFRNYKLIILLLIFFLFGMMSPLTAKMLPDLLEDFAVEGLIIKMPEPTFMDAYIQFFKNVSQMGFIVFLLIFGGILSHEISKGTLIIVLAKGLSRHAVVFSKFLVSLTFWTLSLLIAYATNYGYTVYLFGEITLDHLFFSTFCLWLFGAFVLALIILGSTLTTGSYGGLVVAVAVLGLMLILNILPSMQKYNPVSLASDNVALIAGTLEVSSRVVTVWVTIVLIVLCLVGALQVFKRKRL